MHVSRSLIAIPVLVTQEHWAPCPGCRHGAHPKVPGVCGSPLNLMRPAEGVSGDRCTQKMGFKWPLTRESGPQPHKIKSSVTNLMRPLSIRGSTQQLHLDFSP